MLTTTPLLRRIGSHFASPLARLAATSRLEAFSDRVFASPLAARNRHAADDAIIFDAASHTYAVDGRAYPGSVSGVKDAYFTPFDADAVIAKNLDAWSRNRSSKYWSLARDAAIATPGGGDWRAVARSAILERWSKAAPRGTAVHALIERHMNGTEDAAALRVEAEAAGHGAEYGQYLAWRSTRPDWRPYRSEWCVYSPTSLLAGCIDAVFRDADGELHMVDWKVAEDELSDRVYRGDDGADKMARTPLERLPDTKYGGYCLQQALYDAVYRAHYSEGGRPFRSMRLLQLHSGLAERHRYGLEHAMPRMDEAVDAVMAELAARVRDGTRATRALAARPRDPGCPAGGAPPVAAVATDDEEEEEARRLDDDRDEDAGTPPRRAKRALEREDGPSPDAFVAAVGHARKMSRAGSGHDGSPSSYASSATPSPPSPSARLVRTWSFSPTREASTKAPALTDGAADERV